MNRSVRSVLLTPVLVSALSAGCWLLNHNNFQTRADHCGPASTVFPTALRMDARIQILLSPGGHEFLEKEAESLDGKDEPEEAQ